MINVIIAVSIVFIVLNLTHCCKAWNLRIGIYNGKMVFNRKLGNGWSDLDDFFGHEILTLRKW